MTTHRQPAGLRHETIRAFWVHITWSSAAVCMEGDDTRRHGQRSKLIYQQPTDDNPRGTRLPVVLISSSNERECWQSTSENGNRLPLRPRRTQSTRHPGVVCALGGLLGLPARRFEDVSDPTVVGAVISDILTVVALPSVYSRLLQAWVVEMQPHSQIFCSRRASLGPAVAAVR